MDICCKERFSQNVIPLSGTEADSDLYFSAIGQFESHGNFSWEDIPSHIALHIAYEGRGMLETAAGTFSIHPDSVFVLWPGQRASYRDEPEHPWKYIWFSVDGTKADPLLCQCGLTYGSPVRPAPAGFLAYVRDLVARAERAKSNPLYAKWVAWDCLRLLAESGEPLSPDPASACKLLIDSSPTDIPSVDALATQLDVNRSTLFRHFRNTYGISPKQYIERRRFRKACALLRETSLSIKEIAVTCGFMDSCYFSRAFQKRFGRPPGQWRTLT